MNQVKPEIVDATLIIIQYKELTGMKVLVLPDVHLKPFIFSQARDLMNRGVAERAVCLMDVADDWGKEYCLEEYIKTYDAAISFANDYPNSLWCYGNHDLSYIWDEEETGYSYAARWIVQTKLMELNKVLSEDNPVRYVHSIDNVLFSHGGISRYFVEKYVPTTMYNNVPYVVKTINSLGHKEMWCDDSPIWYRPQYYQGKMYMPRKCLQVVGHTPVERISKGGSVISCDVFSTYQNGTPIGTQELLLIDTVTWEFCGIR